MSPRTACLENVGEILIHTIIVEFYCTQFKIENNNIQYKIRLNAKLRDQQA